MCADTKTPREKDARGELLFTILKALNYGIIFSIYFFTGKYIVYCSSTIS